MEQSRRQRHPAFAYVLIIMEDHSFSCSFLRSQKGLWTWTRQAGVIQTASHWTSLETSQVNCFLPGKKMGNSWRCFWSSLWGFKCLFSFPEWRLVFSSSQHKLENINSFNLPVRQCILGEYLDPALEEVERAQCKAFLQGPPTPPHPPSNQSMSPSRAGLSCETIGDIFSTHTRLSPIACVGVWGAHLRASLHGHLYITLLSVHIDQTSHWITPSHPKAWLYHLCDIWPMCRRKDPTSKL